jgi:molecular chaperone GrpE
VEDGAAEAPADTTAADAPVTVEDLVAALEAVTAERDQHLADLQRVSAEFQNFRKQTEKRNSDFAAQAGSRVAEALLPVLDACDAAAQQGVEGVEPIAGQLRGELERAGLQVIAEVDAPFDPNLHEAAMSEPGDDGQDGPMVAQVLRTGYAWNGRVLRAAMVKVKG